MVKTVKDHQANLLKEISRLDAKKDKLFKSKHIERREIVKPVAPHLGASILSNKGVGLSSELSEVREAHSFRSRKK